MPVASRVSTRHDPAQGIFAVTPDDDNDLSTVTRGIVVGVAGDVNVIMADGSTGVIPALVAGVVHPLQISRILDTSTTAETIVGVY